MYEAIGLAFNQAHQALCTLMLVVLIVELFYHDLNKNVPFIQAKSLIKHRRLFLPYFNTWIRKLHQNCRVLTNVIGGSTSRFKVEARART